jgi:metal-responsive CopG/Arc/MetJ family transcriptional regulator
MKTIAISIDEASLAAVDRLARAARRRPGGGGRPSRSEVIRQAVREFVARHRKREREESDRKVLAENRERIERQVSALVAEQAEL